MAILLNLVKFAIFDLINGVTGISGIAAGYIIVRVSCFTGDTTILVHGLFEVCTYWHGQDPHRALVSCHSYLL